MRKEVWSHRTDALEYMLEMVAKPFLDGWTGQGAKNVEPWCHEDVIKNIEEEGDKGRKDVYERHGSGSRGC
jgi:hypothetical protein